MGNRPSSDDKSHLDEGVSEHIFSASAAMVGVCLTVIGLLQVSNRLEKISVLGDDLLAIDSIIFLSACILSYLGLRTRAFQQQRKQNLERIADICFLLGLCTMAAVCFLITYELV